MIRMERHQDNHFAVRFQRILSTSSLIVGVCAAIAMVMVGLCGIVLYQGRQDAMEHTRDTLRDISLIAQRDIERNFEFYALSLQAVVDVLSDPNVMALPPRLRRLVLFDRAASARYLGAMLVLDAAGNIILDSAHDIPRKGNFADQTYFVVHRDHPDFGLYISDPVQSGDGPSIVLTRRLSHADGSFAGIVLLSINLEYFHNLFAGLSLGPHGTMSLTGRNGVMIMRQPYDTRNIGRNVKGASTFAHFQTAVQGSFIETSSIDGTRRLYWFSNFPRYPLIITVAAAEQDIYAAWWHRTLLIGSLMLIFGSAFVALSILLGIQLRRRMRAESELQLLARTDGLTGLNNRRSLGEILEREWRRARRNRSVMSLLFVDIDRFKAFNDTYGHQAGDDALAAVARCISASIRRPADSAARYGGEEFVVVLPETSAMGATEIAERIRGAISGCGIEHATSEYGRVTASIGVVSRVPGTDDDLSAAIKAADEALYYAKSRGRNRVSLSETT